MKIVCIKVLVHRWSQYKDKQVNNKLSNSKESNSPYGKNSFGLSIKSFI